MPYIALQDMFDADCSRGIRECSRVDWLDSVSNEVIHIVVARTILWPRPG